MSAIQNCSPVELASRLVDAIGPGRFALLNDALSGAPAGEIGAALRMIGEAIATHERAHAQLAALRDYIASLADGAAPTSEQLVVPVDPSAVMQ
ncbi:hypothetical protein [Aestuariivirga sp.]|jgi:hypothetical protein|uniref:hypothetical protein n=1 Tax=Aestuariivirga sp. TaxID=2650926 RepID=UPI00378303A1